MRRLIWTAAAVLAFAGLILALWWKPPGDSSAVAAWVQAFGTVGAICVAIFISTEEGRQAKDERERDRRANEKANALTLLTKMTMIEADLRALLSWFDEIAVDMEERGWRPWQAYRPLADSPQTVTFEPGELVVANQADKEGLISELVKLQRLHSATLQHALLLNERKMALSELMPADEVGDKFMGSSGVTEEVMRRLRPRMAQIDSIFTEARAALTDNAPYARQLMIDTDKALRAYLRWEGGLKFAEDDPKPAH